MPRKLISPTRGYDLASGTFIISKECGDRVWTFLQGTYLCNTATISCNADAQDSDVAGLSSHALAIP